MDLRGDSISRRMLDSMMTGGYIKLKGDRPNSESCGDV